MFRMRSGVTWRQFGSDLWASINRHHLFDGAAALSYYLMLALFPAVLALLSLVPFLPIANVDRAVMDFLREMLPGDAATMFSGVVEEVTHNQKGGLLSLSFLGAIWAANNGTFAVTQILNSTYGVTESRSFFKLRSTALLLTLGLGALIILAFTLIVAGGELQEWLAGPLGRTTLLLNVFSAIRWIIILLATLTAFAVLYFVGPDVEQDFKFITPGSIAGTAILIAASVGFRVYVANFTNFSATYGSIGAVIVLMLWLYIVGVVTLLGSEVNALIEHFSVDGKVKGEKVESEKRGGIAHAPLRSDPASIN